jgi:two-component system, NarL family, sensor kinase
MKNKIMEKGDKEQPALLCYLQLIMIQPKKFVILFLLLYQHCLYAQLPKNKDSLARIIFLDKPDSSTVTALYSYGELFENKNDDSAIYFYKKAKALAEKIGFKKGVAAFASNYIVILNNRGQFREALDVAKEALQLYEAIGDKKDIAVANLNVGSEWQYLSDFSLAADYYLVAKKMAEEVQDKRLERIAGNNLASVLIELEQYEKGKEYAEKALQIAKVLKNDYATASSMCNIANAYMHLKQYNKALDIYREVETIGNKTEDDIVLLDGWLGTGDAQNGLNNYGDAEKYYRKVILFSQQKEMPEYEMYACMGIADLLLKTNRYLMAEDFINRGIVLALKQESKLELKDLYLKASVLNEKKGNTNTALEYRKKFEMINDSIVGEKIRTVVANLEAKYELDKKETTIKQLQAENKLHALEIKQKNILNYILIGSAITLLTISLLSYRNYQHKQKIQQQRISELEKEKQLTATEAVLKGEEQERTRLAKDLHDGLGGMLSGIKYSFANMKGNLIMTEENARSFERSMDMLDSSIKEMRRVAHNLMPEALVKFGLDTALKDFCSDINQSSAIRVNYQSIGLEGEAIPQTTAIAIYRIVQELLNNTIRHAAATNAIVQLTKSGNSISLTVEDDGKGFDTSILNVSKGIGWDNIMHRINFLKGKLDVNSQPGKGTSVLVELGNS